MTNFLKKIIVFSIIPLVSILICVLIYGISIPNLSNSLSFNAKMLFIKEKKMSSNLKVLVVGSSISLNNIHSEAITKSFSSEYLNTASWGQRIADDYKLIKIFEPRFKPETIIISSNYMDFQKEWSKLKFDLIDSYLSDSNILTGFDLRYNIINAKKLKEFRENNTLYDYLNYDVNGGINLEAKNLRIDSIRWKGKAIDETLLDSNQYMYLDSISNFCKVNDISFVFVQGPLAENYYSNLNDTKKMYLNNHIQKVDSIIKRNNQHFIDTSNRPWPDELFADYAHLNKKGAQKFTKLFLDEIKKQKTAN